MKKILSLVLAIGVMITLVGCGGGSSSGTTGTSTGTSEREIVPIESNLLAGKTFPVEDIPSETWTFNETVTSLKIVESEGTETFEISIEGNVITVYDGDGTILELVTDGTLIEVTFVDGIDTGDRTYLVI